MSDTATSPPADDDEVLKKIRQTARTMQGRFDELAKRYDIEELLRHDASQMTVPPAIAQRLSQSIQNEPKPERSWWRRLMDR